MAINKVVQLKPKDGPMTKIVQRVMQNVAKFSAKSRKSRRQICADGGLGPATLTAMLAKDVQSPTLNVFARLCDGMDLHIMTVLTGKLHTKIDVPGNPDMAMCGDVRLLHAPPLSDAHDWKAAAGVVRPSVMVYGPEARHTLAVTMDGGEGGAIAPRGTVVQYRTDLKEPEHGAIVLVKFGNLKRTELRRWSPTYDSQNRPKQIVLEALSPDYPDRAAGKGVKYEILGTVSQICRAPN